jgi:hypothetical protein
MKATHVLVPLILLLLIWGGCHFAGDMVWETVEKQIDASKKFGQFAQDKVLDPSGAQDTQPGFASPEEFVVALKERFKGPTDEDAFRDFSQLVYRGRTANSRTFFVGLILLLETVGDDEKAKRMKSVFTRYGVEVDRLDWGRLEKEIQSPEQALPRFREILAPVRDMAGLHTDLFVTKISDMEDLKKEWDIERFRHVSGQITITPEPSIRGDTATVFIGSKDRQGIELVKIDNRWYLRQFMSYEEGVQLWNNR